jgi:cobalt-zinc-cadmium efflux system protein
VGFLAGSRALVADATHSLTDTLSYGINFSGSRLAAQKSAPPTLGSGLLIASITFLSGIGIAAHNVALLLRGTHTRPGLLGIVVAVASVAVNARLYVMARCATRRSDDHSAYVCLVQVRTDVIASALTFASMLAASLGLLAAAPLCALTIGCLLIVSAISIFRSTTAKTQKMPAWVRALGIAVGSGRSPSSSG